MALTRWLGGGLLFGIAVASCRDGGFCAQPGECPSQAHGGQATQPPLAGAPNAGDVSAEGGAAGEPALAQPPEGGGSGGQSGEGGAAEAGASAGVSGEGPGAPCAKDFAECDASSLTVCETNLSSSVRHCGACGNWCEGACVFGTCQAPELLLDAVSVGPVVLTDRTAYAIARDPSNTVRGLYRFDLANGGSQLLTPLDGAPRGLALVGDRIYVHFDWSVLAFDLDGALLEEVAEEGWPISPGSFGATSEGLYYATDRLPAEDDKTWALRFRPRLVDAWQTVERSSEELTILSSSSRCLALARGTGEHRELFRVDGTAVTKLDAPTEWSDVRAALAEVVVLTSNPNELWWFNEAGASARYGIDQPAYESGALSPASPFGVSIQLRTGADHSVRTYLREGPNAVTAGISRNSTLWFINQDDLWYQYAESWTDPSQLYRTRMLDGL